MCIVCQCRKITDRAVTTTNTHVYTVHTHTHTHKQRCSPMPQITVSVSVCHADIHTEGTRSDEVINTSRIYFPACGGNRERHYLSHTGYTATWLFYTSPILFLFFFTSFLNHSAVVGGVRTDLYCHECCKTEFLSYEIKVLEINCR